MRRLCFVLLSMLLVSGISFGEDGEKEFSFAFDTAVANITPRANSQPVRFPNLTFVLRADTYCPAPEAIASISVSIADSQVTIVPDAEQQGSIEHSIEVSREQLGPIAVDNFCLADDTESLQYLELAGALSAHLSLRCSGENHDSISYATSALDVALQCENETVAAPDQVDSATD